MVRLRVIGGVCFFNLLFAPFWRLAFTLPLLHDYVLVFRTPFGAGLLTFRSARSHFTLHSSSISTCVRVNTTKIVETYRLFSQYHTGLLAGSSRSFLLLFTVVIEHARREFIQFIRNSIPLFSSFVLTFAEMSEYSLNRYVGISAFLAKYRDMVNPNLLYVSVSLGSCAKRDDYMPLSLKRDDSSQGVHPPFSILTLAQNPKPMLFARYTNPISLCASLVYAFLRSNIHTVPVAAQEARV